MNTYLKMAGVAFVVVLLVNQVPQLNDLVAGKKYFR